MPGRGSDAAARRAKALLRTSDTEAPGGPHPI